MQLERGVCGRTSQGISAGNDSWVTLEYSELPGLMGVKPWGMCVTYCKCSVHVYHHNLWSILMKHSVISLNEGKNLMGEGKTQSPAVLTEISYHVPVCYSQPQTCPSLAYQWGCSFWWTLSSWPVLCQQKRLPASHGRRWEHAPRVLPHKHATSCTFRPY